MIVGGPSAPGVTIFSRLEPSEPFGHHELTKIGQLPVEATQEIDIRLNVLKGRWRVGDTVWPADHLLPCRSHSNPQATTITISIIPRRASAQSSSQGITRALPSAAI
jgi:hypothetical protein